MATPNQPQFDMHKFFMPTNQNPNLMLPPPPPSSSYPPPYPPPTGHFPFQFPPFPDPMRSLSYPTPPNNSGAEIMALLLPSQVEPPRMPSGKMAKGRRLCGENVVYDVDVRMQAEAQPQLEVTPITKYTSDPHLSLGRKIAVNKSYICYGLKQGNIRILNINTASRSLFRTHSQRVTDMAFFAEDVHFFASAGIDGRINVWKISEGPDEEDKPQITGKTVIAVQILGEKEIKNPRVCWHCYKQEILVVGVGRSVLRIDNNKVGKGEMYSAEAPLQCHVDKLVDGIQLVGKHDGEVTDLSMCQWMTTRLVSASVDGTIKIWEDLKASPLVVLRPHDGQPVYSAAFLTAANRPDHIVLVTAGPQNRELKIWASSSEEGWLLPGDADSLNCTQKLELKSSSEPRVEEAFFNQVVALSQIGLLLLANAKRNAIYSIHLDYGPNPAATRMDYISEFTVTMPILSLTGTSDVLNGQGVAQIYCVQTQAIQQYTLDLCQCLPPILENDVLEKSDSSVLHEVASEGFAALDSRGSKFSDVPLSSTSVDTATSQDIPSSHMDSRPPNLALPGSDTDIGCVPSSPLPPRSKFTEISVVPSSPLADQVVNQTVIDYSVDLSSADDDVRNDVRRVAQDDNSSALNSHVVFKHPTHLITPSEILMGVASSEFANANERKTDEEASIQDVVVNNETDEEASIQDVVVNNDLNGEVEVKIVGETSSPCNNEFGLREVSKGLALENKEKVFSSQATVDVEIGRECCATSDAAYNMEEFQQTDGVGPLELHPQSSLADEEEVQETSKDASGSESVHGLIPQLTSPTTKGKKQKGKNSQAVGQFSLTAPSNSLTSNEQCGTSGLSMEAAFPQIMAIQDMLTQLMTTQKEMQKQMSNMVAVPVSKEGKRLEAALGRSIEKSVKANNDALWTRFQEENAKNEKYMRERTQQITNSISNFINKDLVTMIEKTVKKELTSIGSSVARTISPVIEKTISSAISESFQRGVGDKAVNQLEKSVNSKLEATVARQIQAQFQTTGRQTLQDALRVGLETSVVPAFEKSCKTMFEQVDATFRKGMVEHTTAAQQHLDTAHSSLAIALREAINTASALAQNLGGELADSQRKLLALAAAGANSGAANPLVSQLSNGPVANFHEKVETHLDPMKELTRFITEQKYEEAFTIALQRSDVSIVSWLCSQVDMRGLLSNVPIRLSQGVLLSLLQQLACDINSNTTQKLSWMTDVAAVINPTDQMIAVHVRPIMDQVYKIVLQLRSLPTTTGTEMAAIRILLHVINAIFAKM